jgi:hypothetical protein
VRNLAIVFDANDAPLPRQDPSRLMPRRHRLLEAVIDSRHVLGTMVKLMLKGTTPGRQTAARFKTLVEDHDLNASLLQKTRARETGNTRTKDCNTS